MPYTNLHIKINSQSFIHGIAMSGSNVKGHSDLFTEARLPPDLVTRVKELGQHMKPLVEAAAEQKPYSIVDCAAGGDAVEHIYDKYNEIVVKVSVHNQNY